MFINSFNHIKDTFRSSFFSLTRHSAESINVRIITDPYTGEMTLGGSPIIFQTPVIPTISSSEATQLAQGFNGSPLSSSDHFGYTRSLVEASASINGIYAAPLSPNSRLFRGSQDEFGFDVYITHDNYQCGPAYLFECPIVLPWDELVIALAEEAGREPKQVVLFSNFYPGIVNDKASYQAWLAWSRKNDGPCSTDLWLASNSAVL